MEKEYDVIVVGSGVGSATVAREMAGAGRKVLLLEAANNAGYHWERLDNFIDPARCLEDCGDCMLGCKRAPSGQPVFTEMKRSITAPISCSMQW
jgi:heterodisulfide reductase subunit A-like polyferredoxin